MSIVPAILTTTFDEFKRQALRLEGIFDLAQIDVMDGQFVLNTSFPDVDKINDLNLKLNWELHLMVTHPLQELEKWAEVKNIQRVIFHIESSDNPTQVIAAIRGKCYQVGLAINPETPLSAIEPYVNQVDEVLFMTVHPGQQGAKFLPEVGTKIQQFNNLTINNHPLIAVDGGINAGNIALVKSWGVDVFGVGSAISKSLDIQQTYQSLNKLLQ